MMRNYLFLLGSIFLAAEENFILMECDTGKVIETVGSRIDDRVTPYCSFNIALSLMGYDAGILNDDNEPFFEGKIDYKPSWRTSQTPFSLMKMGCFWVFLLLYKELGLERFQHYLKLFDYGNQDVTERISSPWVGASLHISPREQVCFVRKLLRGELPVSAYAVEMTRALIFKEELEDGWKLYGKTGAGSLHYENDPTKVAWFVGWIEKSNRAYIFAYNNIGNNVDSSQSVLRSKAFLILDRE